MLLLQAAAGGAAHGAGAADHAGAFHPTLPWLILLFPLLGFVANGLLSAVAARRALPVVPPVGDPHWDAHGHADDAHAHAAHDPAAASEQEHLDHGTRPSPVDAAAAHDAHEHGHGHAADEAHDDHAPAGPKPFTHLLPSFIAPGVMLAAFGVAVANFLRMRAAHLEHPWVHSYFDWLVVGGESNPLSIGAALQVDPLSMVMTLVVTGVGTLIHLFSVGYMQDDPGYPRYFAYLNL
ncbi:MAG TPA: hypothetical protein VNP72_11545, partial [Longimicrobium sp.]|nr:hypothetical protein [Longimicrobium sp.]